MKDFRKLQVWQKAHRLALLVYQMTQRFPRDEMYGLTGQMRRAAVSIPANIAEGCGRNSDADFARYLHIAAGSASELEYFFILAHDLKYIKPDDAKMMLQQAIEIKKMLATYIKRIKTNDQQSKAKN